MLPNVEYRGVPGFPGYRVGSDGSVWSQRNSHGMLTGKWMSIRPYLTSKRSGGYLRVSLSIGKGLKKKFHLHQLMLMAFVGPQPKGMVTRHLNGDRMDNRLSNLKYGTPKENSEDMVSHGTHPKGEQVKNAVLTTELVKKIRMDTKGVTFKHGEREEYAREIGISPSLVSAIKGYHSWKHITV